MNPLQRCFLLLILTVVNGRLADGATESVGTSSVSATLPDEESFSSATPAPSGTEAVNSTGAEVPAVRAVNFTVNTTLSESEAPTVATEAPAATTVQPAVSAQGKLHLRLGQLSFLFAAFIKLLGL